MVKRIRIRGHVIRLFQMRPSTSRKRPPTCPSCRTFYNDSSHRKALFLCCGYEDCLECVLQRTKFTCPTFLKEEKKRKAEVSNWREIWLKDDENEQEQEQPSNEIEQEQPREETEQEQPTEEIEEEQPREDLEPEQPREQTEVIHVQEKPITIIDEEDTVVDYEMFEMETHLAGIAVQHTTDLETNGEGSIEKTVELVNLPEEKELSDNQAQSISETNQSEDIVAKVQEQTQPIKNSEVDILSTNLNFKDTHNSCVEDEDDRDSGNGSEESIELEEDSQDSFSQNECIEVEPTTAAETNSKTDLKLSSELNETVGVNETTEAEVAGKSSEYLECGNNVIQMVINKLIPKKHRNPWVLLERVETEKPRLQKRKQSVENLVDPRRSTRLRKSRNR